jgi:hypothetical protein
MQRNIDYVINRKTGRNTVKAGLALRRHCTWQPAKEFS